LELQPKRFPDELPIRSAVKADGIALIGSGFFAD
jgi:hypothetical protein